TVTAEALAAVYRYERPDELRRDLDALGAADLILLDEHGTAQATETGHRLLAEMYAIDAEIAASLWRGQMPFLPGLNDAAGRLVTAALATGGPAYLTMAPPHEPADATVGLLLHHRLSVLRYHRADAHAAAWQDAGLTSQAIQQLAAGPTRDAVEARTNGLAGTPYSTLAPDERLNFLAGLAALPG
ncbi:MAG TPA: hypothetical protein VKB59_16070, partial [Micromonosporaceae bacterium]|nr:hypothetical protein [Micromonosporaceae bacterium]